MKAKSQQLTTWRTWLGKGTNTRTRRSPHRRSGRLAVESLENRELMAVNLGADMGIAIDMNDNVAPRPPAVVAPPNPNGNGGVVNPAPATVVNVGQIIGATTGTFQIVPPVLGAEFKDGVLTVTGSNDADNLSIYVSNGKMHVHEVVKGLTLRKVPLVQVKSIVVNANGGNDWVNVDESITVPATLRGGSGDDTLQGGAGADNLYGGPGNDELLGRGGNDSLNGDHGDDLLIGGDGNDVIYGGVGNDYLVGGNGNDWLMGEDGNDQLFGEAGNDLLFGGPGQNLIDGGAGDDMLYGGDDVDAMYGGDGNDSIRGFAGDDRLRGDGGNDDIIADAGSDIADGGDGDDQVRGDLGNDVLSGGLGNDILAGGEGQDWLHGESGSDVLNGQGGNDLLQGGTGADQLNGGTGSNQLYQDRLPGEQLGQITQALSWGDVGDFFGDVWEGITEVFKWTVDKAKTIGLRFYDWASHIDDRLFRLGGDLAGALSNWPWKAEFWKGLGRSLVDTLEVFGLGEAWEIAFEILKPWQRGMTSEEISVARGVFGNSIPYDRVRLDEHSLMAGIGRTHVTGYIINSTKDLDDPSMIHELTHVWQYVTDGLVYIPEALDAQAGDGYEYGGLADLRTKMAAGKGISAYNREQQGDIVKDYFKLRLKVRQDYEANGKIAPLSVRQNLDVYIHFVKRVSTLTAAQLDTPDA